MRRPIFLQLSLAAYGAASLAHFAHNAVYLREYPHMPVWLTAMGVSAAWCVQTGVGLLGYWLYRHGSRMTGAVAMTVYGMLGFAALDHYMVAPIAAHTTVMHLTIVGEAFAATAFLACLARSMTMAPIPGRATTARSTTMSRP